MCEMVDLNLIEEMPSKKQKSVIQKCQDLLANIQLVKRTTVIAN